MKEYDVVVIGCGASGIGVAYALKDSGKKVLMIDQLSEIGGTHLNAWVNVHAVTPPPPFLKAIIDDMIAEGNASYVNSEYENQSGFDYLDTYLNKKYTGRESACISFNIETMRERYKNDLSSIEFMLNTSFEKVVEYKEGKLSSIQVSTNEEIHADVFIDCSANDVLIRAIERYWGTEKLSTTGLDKQNQFGFMEVFNSNKTLSWPYVNDPTLMYRIEKGIEDLSKIDKKFPNDALIYVEPGTNSGTTYWYVNTVNYLEEEGRNAISDEKGVYDRLIIKTKQHWKTIKEGNSSRLQKYDLNKKHYAEHAPILGLRETYRTLCERMLSANNLCTLVTQKDLQESGLDSIIAVGNHPVDIHGAGSNLVDVKALNTHIRPYGVQYGSLIPLHLKNVLVASRGAGFTHIAAASFRLNKNMMQLGWVAGKAAILFKDDFRNVDSAKLQELIEIKDTLEKVEKLMQLHTN